MEKIIMDDEIFLERPSIKHKTQAINFIEEVEKVDDLRIRYSGFSRLQNYKDNYEDWLKEIELYSKKETVKEGLVPADVFFSIRKQDNKVVGIINIRRELNDFLYDFGGHIGYSILPSERRKGYAYKQLLLALKYCKSIHINRVLITCLEENIGSYKTIEKAGGVLENIVRNEKEGETLKRYWISLKKRYADRHVGERTQNTELKTISVKDNCFKGDIYFYSFSEVKEKIIIPSGKCILDNNYRWLEFYNYDSKIKLTAIYNENNSIIEWYFDIARKIGKDNGVPYEDDLYLDVVVTPEGKIILLDEDELKEAFNKREMTKAEYDEAYKIAYDLIENLKINKIKLQEYTDKYLDNFLMKENKGKVIALCGKVACGKTYYASKLKEKENAIIFSVDELTFYMFDNRKGENYTDLTNRAINYFKEKSIEIVDKGVNVILDIGLWSKKERKELSEFFKSKNVNLEIHYIDIDDKSWEENIKERNKRIDEGKRGFDFYISDGLRKKIKENWEEPDEKEIDVWYNFKRDK